MIIQLSAEYSSIGNKSREITVLEDDEHEVELQALQKSSLHSGIHSISAPTNINHVREN